jgi:hypothetical protein
MKPIEIKPLKPAPSSEANANEGMLSHFESLKLKYPVVNFAYNQLTNPDTSILPYLLLAFELVLNIAIVYKVPCKFVKSHTFIHS